MDENIEITDDTKTETAPARHTKRRRVVIAAAATLAVIGVGVGGVALHQHGIAQGRAAVVAAPVINSQPPTLRSNDATCGSRLELHSGDKVYALMLDGPNEFRVLDVTAAAKVPSGGCSLGRDIPGGPKTEDSTGASSAQIRSGWDTHLNRCSRYVTIDGRRWLLDDPQFTEIGYLAHGGYGRLLAGDARCGGDLPMQPYGGAQCPDPGYGWHYAWDAVRGECVQDSPAENRGEPQGVTTK
ncbi:hypothetical protein [Mycobacteroides abscessus]|uniref:hypothetical protein n=1 Tax=Mycobacteroides abscessus TaxID=36809 RepID=UPI00148FB570|nr:hypothetical protein [Mycobacteroides abscessus]